MLDRMDLVNHLEKQNYIQSSRVKKAFMDVPREKFLPPEMKDFAYSDTPLSIGNGQTISAPHMIAIMVEALDLKPGQKILEIGTGSGYHAAIVSRVIEKTGHVYSIERYKSLADSAKDNLNAAGVLNVTVKLGDGSTGLEEHAPYDRIYVTCASPSIPRPLIHQLKDPGILLVPVGKMYCELMKLTKKDGEELSENLGGCAFVPLIGEYGY